MELHPRRYPLALVAVLLRKLRPAECALVLLLFRLLLRQYLGDGRAEVFASQLLQRARGSRDALREQPVRLELLLIAHVLAIALVLVLV